MFLVNARLQRVAKLVSQDSDVYQYMEFANNNESLTILYIMLYYQLPTNIKWDKLVEILMNITYKNGCINSIMELKMTMLLEHPQFKPTPILLTLIHYVHQPETDVIWYRVMVAGSKHDANKLAWHDQIDIKLLIHSLEEEVIEHDGLFIRTLHEMKCSRGFLKDYVKNPLKTHHRLRKQLGYNMGDAARLWILLALINDGYLFFV